MLTADDIRLIFEIIEEVHGRGYANDKKVGQLQAKLSIMLEVKTQMESS